MANPTTPMPYMTNGQFNVPYGEFVVGGYQEQSVTATRVLYCAWLSRRHFRMDILGDAFWNADGSMTRYAPAIFPDDLAQFGGDNILARYAISADLIDSIKGGVPFHDPTTHMLGYVEAPTATGTFDGTCPEGLAYYNVTYAPLGYVVKTGNTFQPLTSAGGTVYPAIGSEFNRCIERLHDYSTDNRPIPGNAFVWVPAPDQKIPTPQIKPEHTRLLFYKWHGVPLNDDTQTPKTTDRIPLALEQNWDNTIGKVNLGQWDGRYPSGSVLVLAPHVERSTMASGAPMADIACAMQVKLTLWNRQYFKAPPAAGVYADFSVDGTASTTDGNRLFDSGDPAAMFAWAG